MNDSKMYAEEASCKWTLSYNARNFPITHPQTTCRYFADAIFKTDVTVVDISSQLVTWLTQVTIFNKSWRNYCDFTGMEIQFIKRYIKFSDHTRRMDGWKMHATYGGIMWSTWFGSTDTVRSEQCQAFSSATLSLHVRRCIFEFFHSYLMLTSTHRCVSRRVSLCGLICIAFKWSEDMGMLNIRCCTGQWGSDNEWGG